LSLQDQTARPSGAGKSPAANEQAAAFIPARTRRAVERAGTRAGSGYL
jgi:hypothetical protein